jgi:hypothetical protein
MKALRISPQARATRIGSLAIAFAFAAGWASASAPLATRINTGLVNAFGSVGQSLFGSAVFDAVAVPPNPVSPEGAVQLDLAVDSQIPVAMGVFVPPNPIAPTDPCRKFVQLEVQDGNVVVAVDPDAAPDGFPTVVEFKSLAAFAPRVDRCAAPPPTID